MQPAERTPEPGGHDPASHRRCRAGGQRAVHRRLRLRQSRADARQGVVQPRQSRRSGAAAGFAVGAFQPRRLRAGSRLGRDRGGRAGAGAADPLADPAGGRAAVSAPVIVAVDGPTASGKGTIAQALAAHFGLPHLDTGLLYRAVGRQVALAGGNPDDPADALAGTAFADPLLADPVLRDEATGGLASRVSVHPAVRAALFDRQRAFALQPGGAVLDGRDIGTVIAPEAAAKLFVTASIAARALRRWKEMAARGDARTLAQVEADLALRDKRDRSRAHSPLLAAPDAIVLDTSELDRDAAIAAAIAAVEERLRG
ncbi:MAG: (d)CMP kinase [Porphyrobacter sp.]|nr:(d)CMP kinase [Porphyrobacter sp.]